MYELFSLLRRFTASANIRRMFLCLCLAALQGVVFVGVQYAMTGALSVPLDDSFIHFQYGRQIAEGHYFRYQDQAPPSSGATSFLYAHVIALGAAGGFKGNLIILWSHFVAWLSLAVVLHSLLRIGDALSLEGAGRGAVWLVLLSGHLAWGYWSGMEIALFSALLLAVYSEILSSKRNLPRLFILMSFLAVCRPEGQVISVVLVALLILEFFLFDRPGKSTVSVLRLTASASGFLLAVVLPNAIQRFLLGTDGSNGLKAKSVFFNPVLGTVEKWDAIGRNLVGLFHFFMGDLRYTSGVGEFVPPGLLLFAVLGLAGLIYFRRRRGVWLSILLAGPLLIALLAISTIEVWSLHSYRYLLPLIPLLLLLGLIGVETSLAFWNVKTPIFAQGAVFIAGLILLTFFPLWITRFAEQSTTIYEKQIRAADWITRSLPDSHPVAVNDAGALAYFGQKPLYDLVGLVTNETTLPYRMGEGSLYEEMEWIPEPERPLYSVVFPSWFEEMARIYDIFDDPRVTFPDPFDWDFGKTVYRINWNYSGMEDRPRQATMRSGWVVRDSIDIADRRSEIRRNYFCTLRKNRFPDKPIPFRRNFGYHEEIDQKWPGIEKEQDELIPLLKTQGILNQYDIVDAGRRIEMSEEFTFSGLAPNRDCFLILRTCENRGSHPRFHYRMAVYVNDIYVSDWTAEGTPWNWYELVLRIPSEAVTETDLRIRVVNRGTPDYSYYDSYYYWICQES